jgi:hypothetical protein
VCGNRKAKRTIPISSPRRCWYEPNAEEDTPGIGDTGGQRNGDDVIARRPEEILDYLPVRCSRKLQDCKYVPRVAAHEDYIRRLDRYVRPRANRDAKVGFDQRRRVIDAITDHGHSETVRFGLPYPLHFLMRQSFGKILVESKSRGDRPGDLFRIASDHHAPYTQRETAWKDSCRITSARAMAPTSLSSMST